MTRTSACASLIGLLAAGFILVTVLSGCSSAPGAAAPGAGTPATSTASAAPTPTAPAERPPSASVLSEQIIKLAEAANPSVEVSAVVEMPAARASNGDCWVAGSTVPVNADKYKSERVIIRQKSGAWVLFGIGDAIVPESMPGEVRGIL
jgi:hypothetical protein